ncbi:UGMP family protein [Candidatus Micrarchaeota archaeon CG10_big_fil_rev_8_21_14_0_10_45_29]|nr:MAG: UGMP family protein [Candidatus Micrarchaeota archaeon CG10_big_fil_rev_8_21_14_0_10_45_29]
MKILGIESTAHTFGVGVYDSTKNKILANEKAYYKTPPGEGIIPRKAAEHHAKNAAQTISLALKKAKIKMKNIGAIAYSAGPGLGPCLQTGATAASFLAQKYDLPLLPANHAHAHIEVGKAICKFSDPLILYVSGGNTQIIIEQKKPEKENAGKSFRAAKKGKKFLAGKEGGYLVLGETLDIGVGNLFDSFARELGYKFAHGGILAKKAAETEKFHLMPYTVKGMNFAFSGLFTYAKSQIGKMDEAQICNSFMKTAFCELCEASERALMLTGKKEVLVCGGVAQNKQLMKMMQIMAKSHGAKAGTCENEYNADNGAMISLLGARLLKEGKAIDAKKAWIEQKWRVDMVM